MTFVLPALPFALNALEPHISARTFEFHHGKHHLAYINNLNALTKDTPLASMAIEDIIHATANDDAKAGIFNNAAQVWNHTFFWNSLTPKHMPPPKPLAEKIEIDFGSFDAFKEQFKQAAVGQFGSGWAWLVADRGKLKVVKTPNAMNPMIAGQTPLLTCDVWEHAYYLDYQNRRPDFVQAFLDNLANWAFAAANLAAAK